MSTRCWSIHVSPADPDTAPRNVLLFSGHMIDAPGRKEPRFPPNKEPVVADALAKLLNSPDVAANSSDLAICGGACGGDMLFAEACLARRTSLEFYIPFDENKFLVDFRRLCRRRLAQSLFRREEQGRVACCAR